MNSVVTSGIIAEVIDVTPDQAAEWIAANTNNRTVRVRTVAMFAKDMAAGNWKMTGEAIKIAPTGRLLDGQHRLHAVIKSDTTVPMLVLFGINESAQRVMDTGGKRTAGDHLGMLGYRNAVLLAAATRLTLIYERGLIYRDRAAWDVSTTDIEDYAEKHADMRDAVDVARANVKKIDITPSVLATAILLTKRSDPAGAEAFWSSLSSMTGMEEGSPVLALARRLAELRRTGAKKDVVTELSLVIRAWNAYRQGRSVQKLPVHKKGKAVRFSYVA